MKEHDPVKALRNDVGITAALAVRGIKIFLADKMGVFFSLLAPIIILMLYLLFLGDIQIDALKAQLEGIPYEEKTVSAIVDGWMIAGVMAVSCITVTFTSQNVLVKDRENGTLADFLAAPVKRGVIAASYMIFNIIVSAIICLAVLCLAFIYLAITGWYLTAADVFAAIGNTLLSIISVSVLATLASLTFIKTEGAHSGFVGILSAAIGFLIGAYMPVSTFPTAIQYVTLFLPGTYSAGIFRSIFMEGAIAELGFEPVREGIREAYSVNIDFFGKTIGVDIIAIIFVSVTVLLFAAYAVIQIILVKKNKFFNK